MFYETFDHTADVGLRMRASSLEELFAEAGRALFSLVVADLAAVRDSQSISVELPGDALDLLLFDWLSELLYIYETRQLLFSQFDVLLAPGLLRATARGEPVDCTRHQLDHEVKAITYHGLKVERAGEAWLAEVVVDI